MVKGELNVSKVY